MNAAFRVIDLATFAAAQKRIHKKCLPYSTCKYSERNACYFIPLAHKVRCGCWWMVCQQRSEPSHQYSITY